MIRLYRRFLNNKTTHILNIATLVLGLVSFIYIFNYVYIHQNFDNYQPNAEHLYKIHTRIFKDGALANHWPSTPIQMAPTLKDRFPEIQDYTRYCEMWEENVVSNKDRSLRIQHVIYADTNFFNVFAHEVVLGNLTSALSNTNSVVITESMQKLFFGESDPIGQVLTIHNDKREPRKVFVSAVVRDIPDNSELSFDMVATLPLYIEVFGNWVNSWPMHAASSYLLLKPGADVAALQAKFDAVVNEKLGDFARSMGRTYQYYLTNIADLHYVTDFTMFSPSTAVSRTSLKIMLNVGMMILIISLVNNLNFQLSQVHSQLKNIGIQKIIGSKKRRLLQQFFIDSFALNLSALLITLCVLYLLSPWLNGLFQINFTTICINSARLWIIILSVFVGLSLVATLYPALVIARVSPLLIMQRKVIMLNPQSGLKRALVSFQFGASIFLIIATLLVQKQKLYLQEHTQGFDPGNTLAIQSPMTTSDESFRQHFVSFKDECMKIPGVERVSYTSCIPGYQSVKMPYVNPAKPETSDSYYIIESDFSYLNILHTQLLAGRYFENNESDQNSIILNESACRAFGFENAQAAIGNSIQGDNRNRTIIGVIQDYNHVSPKYAMTPYIYLISDFRTRYFLIEFNKHNLSGTLASVNEQYSKFFPDNPFIYRYLNDEYADQYKSENQLATLFLVFSMIAIAISCLGLIGLSLIESKLRIKEIGIRKVNGARLSELLSELNRDYLKWVGFAFLITVPLAWYAMHRWLENFASKTVISWWLFALAGGLALCIALLTVSWQSWRAANRNPVEALRQE